MNPDTLVCVPLDTPIPDVNDLKAKGATVIRTNFPDRVRVVSPATILPESDMIMAAMEALSLNPGAYNERSTFVVKLYERMRIREQQTQQTPT